jgi:tRNA-dihydrouridine synthase
MLTQTGCAGTMVARGGLGNPWLFREALALLEGREVAPPTPAERLTVALRHLELFIATAGERVALREMRKHLSWYSHGLPGAAAFRDAVNRLAGKEALVDAVRRFFEGSTHGS